MTDAEKPQFTVALPLMSWDKPIELEILQFCRSMAASHRRYIDTTIWGGRQKREAECYARAYETVIDHIQKEVRLRKKVDDIRSKND